MPSACILKNGHTDSVNALSLSDRLLISAGEDGSVCLWSPDESCVPVSKLTNPQSCMAVKFHPKHQNNFYTSHGETIYSWDVRQLNIPQREWNVNEDEVNSLDVLADEPTLAAADDSGQVKIIDTVTGDVIRTLDKHRSICSAAKFRPERNWQLISGDMSGRLFVTDWKDSGRRLFIFELPELVALSLEDHESSEGSDSDELERPGVEGCDREADVRNNHDPSSTDSSDASSASTFNQSSGSPILRQWTSSFPVNPPMVHGISCTPSGDLVAAGLGCCSVALFQGADRRLRFVKSLAGHSMSVSVVHFLNNSTLLSGGNDMNLFLWDMDSNFASRCIPHQSKLNAIEGREVKQVFLADCSPEIHVVDLST